MPLAVWDEAAKGEYAAIDRVLKILERRAKLLGLDMPVRHDILIKEESQRLAEKYGLDPAAIIREAEAIVKGRE